MGGYGSTRWGGHARRATVEGAAAAGAPPLAVCPLRPTLDAPGGRVAELRVTTPGAPAWWGLAVLQAAGTPGGAPDPAPSRALALCATVADAARLAHPAGPGPAPGPPVLAWWDADAVAQRAPRGAGRRGAAAGRRWWWTCPGCRARRAVLFLAPVRGAAPGAPGSVAPRCRACLGLAYVAQRCDPYDRATRAAQKAAGALGADYFDTGGPSGYAPRPKGMRRATYARLLGRLEDADARRDALYLDLSARLLDRIAPGWRDRA